MSSTRWRVDHPRPIDFLLPQRPHPSLERLVYPNVKWLAEASAAAGDPDYLNAKIGDGVGYRCHHVASVRVE